MCLGKKEGSRDWRSLFYISFRREGKKKGRKIQEELALVLTEGD